MSPKIITAIAAYSTSKVAAFLKSEIAKWGKVIRDSGAKADP